jgi:hypothetical protein
MGYGPNGLAVCSRTAARTGIAARTGTIEPGRMPRSEPGRCHIVVVRAPGPLVLVPAVVRQLTSVLS